MTMLTTETNTLAMKQRVRLAFRYSRHYRGRFWAFFEHGQWWVEDRRSGSQWSVVDAVGGDSIDGFDFELVSAGEEA